MLLTGLSPWLAQSAFLFHSGPTHSELGPSISVIDQVNDRLAHRTIWWGHFFFSVKVPSSQTTQAYVIVTHSYPVVLIWGFVPVLLDVRVWLSTAGQGCPQRPRVTADCI